MPCGNWSSALRHLAADGILDGRSVVEGRVTFDDMSRSNEVAMLGVDGQPVMVLKRRGVAIDDVDPLVAEVDCLRWLATDATTAAIAPDLVAAFDDVVVTATAGTTTLSEALLVADHDAHIRLLHGLGRSLAVLHSAEPDLELLVPRRPWVLDVVNSRVPDTLAGDPDIEALVERVNHNSAIVTALERLAATWSDAGAIHGDVKFDNVVVVSGALDGNVDDPMPVGDLVLVDWELAGLGPPVWDLAGVVVGIIVPQLLTGDLDGVDVDDVRRSLGPLLDTCHRSSDVHDLELITATVVRMVQTSFQLCAMRHLDPVHGTASTQVFDAAATMAAQRLILDDGALVS